MTLDEMIAFGCFGCVFNIEKRPNDWICLQLVERVKGCKTYTEPKAYEEIMFSIAIYEKKHGLVPGEHRRVEELSSRYIEEVFREESHKPIKGSGGEKNDRTHKLFGKQRMKDNRYIPPWPGGDLK